MFNICGPTAPGLCVYGEYPVMCMTECKVGRQQRYPLCMMAMDTTAKLSNTDINEMYREMIHGLVG